MKKIGAEFILAAMVLPFAIWITSSIYDLRADYSDLKALKEKIEELKNVQEKTNNKIDHLTDYLINQGREK